MSCQTRFLMLMLTCTFGLGLMSGCQPSADIVVYCAHDAVYAEQIIDRFEQQTGLEVWVRYDTEATKSLGLVNLLLSQKGHPECDLFWNNQMLGTLELAEQGLLEPYKAKQAERIPDRFKDENGLWTGFAARLRLLIHPPNLSESEGKSFSNLTDTATPDFAIANPIYGTTLTHYAVLWSVWGESKLKHWHDEAVLAGRRQVAGNSQVRDAVVNGGAKWGYTDTDDFLVARLRGDAVVAEPVLIGGKSLCIPNTVCLIKGGPHPKAAKQLIEFLLSEEVERELANSESGQIPLGPTDLSTLPEYVQQWSEWAQNSHDLRGLLQARRDTLSWLLSGQTDSDE